MSDNYIPETDVYIPVKLPDQISKREYFAGLAMQALLATSEPMHQLSRAKAAVMHADALIAALNEPKT